ncbi:uncharacterized protein IUM83_01246 [Phytophthora cinnamomi]|uniref:uncharacterized protein n=1 Tax=Phytophthora cinnamomi TaxID=4785 RepID=UPI0035597309|nr:hypothetical protein IUM83_01246 [Phytophthora cinnamomi]
MSAPQKKNPKAVESHFSIDDYFERQTAKYGDVVDFDDDDDDMEDEKDSSSKRRDSVSPRAATAARDSKAQGSPRAAPAARDPWMPSASEISDRYGNSVPPNEVPLYVCSAIKDDAVAAELHFDAETHQRRDYYIGLFHELRWFQSKKTSSRSKVPEWQTLCQSWSAFVENFNKKPSAYRDRIKQARDRFETYSKRGKLEQLHLAAEEANVPCAVPEGFQCAKCFQARSA